MRALLWRKHLWVFTGLLFCSPAAHASDLRVSARSAAEAYSVTAARSGLPSMTRRRLVQYLGLEWQDILPPEDRRNRRRDPQKGQLRVFTQLRLEHAFGDFREGATGRARVLIDAQQNRQLDLLFGYLEGRRIGRVLDFKLGRQLDFAQLDFFAFDGLALTLSPPGRARRLVSLVLWGGLQVRSDSPLGAGGVVFEPLDAYEDPIRRPRERGYLLGVAVASRPTHWLKARAGMRRAFGRTTMERPEQELDPAAAGLSAFSQGVEQSLAFAQLSAFAPNRRFFFNGSASYDLARRDLSLTNLSATFRVAPRHRLRLTWIRTLPLLDLDSIFSVFDVGAFQEGRLRYAWTLAPGWELASRMHLRHRGDPQAQTSQPLGWGGALSLALQKRHHAASIHTRVHSEAKTWQVSTLARWGYAPTKARWSLDLWIHHAQAMLKTRRYALSGAISGQVRLFSGVAIRGLVETLTSKELRQSTRVFASLVMDSTLRMGGR